MQDKLILPNTSSTINKPGFVFQFRIDNLRRLALTQPYPEIYLKAHHFYFLFLSTAGNTISLPSRSAQKKEELPLDFFAIK